MAWTTGHVPYRVDSHRRAPPALSGEVSVDHGCTRGPTTDAPTAPTGPDAARADCPTLEAQCPTVKAQARSRATFKFMFAHRCEPCAKSRGWSTIRYCEAVGSRGYREGVKRLAESLGTPHPLAVAALGSRLVTPLSIFDTSSEVRGPQLLSADGICVEGRSDR